MTDHNSFSSELYTLIAYQFKCWRCGYEIIHSTRMPKWMSPDIGDWHEDFSPPIKEPVHRCDKTRVGKMVMMGWDLLDEEDTE